MPYSFSSSGFSASILSMLLSTKTKLSSLNANIRANYNPIPFDAPVINAAFFIFSLSIPIRICLKLNLGKLLLLL